jgi:glycerol kinase
MVGHTPPVLDNLNVYHAWSIPGAGPGSDLLHTYCLEADTTTTGAAVRWMHEQAHLLDYETEIDELVQTVSNTNGVIFIPAFTGLNVPYNDHNARGTILGLRLSTNRAHIVRAFLESLGFQLRAILETIQMQTGFQFSTLSLGGGLSKSDHACQIQADLLGIPTIRPAESETTARGAALLAGMGAGFWPDLSQLPPLPNGSKIFEPQRSQDQRDEGYDQWQRAVEKVRSWATPE